MNSFKKKVLASAVVATMSGAAHAVYVDPNGLGQVLIYPYYTVQGGHNTYISVVNTTTQVKVAKVRFREGRNSAEVLDFNLYLSPNDVWTGAVVPSTDTAGGRVITSDTSCTNPPLSTSQGGAGFADFRNFLYTGDFADGGLTGLERTREGYIELIEMGVLPAGSLANAATHSGAVKPTCTGLAGLGLTAVSNAIAAPTGGLSGTGTLINVTNGQDSGYSALALAAVTESQIYGGPEDEAPILTSVVDPRSVVVSGNRVYSSTFTNSNRRDALSSVIMHSSVLNEYVLDTATFSNTDWVLTFPTKKAYVTTASASTPFTNKFTASGACEAIDFTFYDREERTVTGASVDFSPRPPSATGAALCWESTVLSIRNGTAHTTAAASASGVLGSANYLAVSVTPGFQNGWASLTFSGTNAKNTGIVANAGTTTNVGSAGGTSQQAPTFLGLPVVGFMVRTFNNGTLGNFQANYGSAFEHKYRQSITPTP